MGDAVVTATYAPDMVICESSTRSADQCGAEAAFCNTAAGWTMCNATQFLARGGASLMAGPAWLRSCVRDAADPFAPTDALCSSCAPGEINSTEVMWTCLSVTSLPTITWARVGVGAAELCLRVGDKDPGWVGNWSPYQTSVALPGAVCCSN